MRRDNYIRIAGVTRADNEEFDNDLTLSMLVVDSSGDAITDGDAAMPNTDDGEYTGVIAKECDLESLTPDDTGYRRCTLQIDDDGLQHARRIACKVFFEGWDQEPRTLYIGQSNYFELRGVMNPDGTGVKNDYEPVLTLYDPQAGEFLHQAIEGTSVTNGSVTLASLGSSGNYAGYIPGNAAIEEDKQYVAFIVDDDSGRAWAFKCVASVRGKA